MTTKSTTKRAYEKPQMRVYELRQGPQLLAGSYKTTDSGKGGTGAQDYTWHDDIPEE